MKAVVLYFPYFISLKAFVAEEKLRNVKVDSGDVFLKTLLNQEQINKACTVYGAIVQ
jgi:hypothetical protein